MYTPHQNFLFSLGTAVQKYRTEFFPIVSLSSSILCRFEGKVWSLFSLHKPYFFRVLEVVVGIDGKPFNKCITAHRTYLVASNDVKVILGEKKIGILISHYALFRVIFGTIHILRQLIFAIFDIPLPHVRNFFFFQPFFLNF